MPEKARTPAIVGKPGTAVAQATPTLARTSTSAGSTASTRLLQQQSVKQQKGRRKFMTESNSIGMLVTTAVTPSTAETLPTERTPTTADVSIVETPPTVRMPQQQRNQNRLGALQQRKSVIAGSTASKDAYKAGTPATEGCQQPQGHHICR
jgi:hypothetical protein